MRVIGQSKLDKAAFTLVELLAVITIVAILLGLVLGLQGRVREKMLESRIQSEMSAIELALESYKSKNGQYPPGQSWLGQAYPFDGWDKYGDEKEEGGNQLYMHLVASPLSAKERPFLTDIKENHRDNDALLVGALFDAGLQRSGTGIPIKWNYNSLKPQYNKGSYDLWVEFGDLGDDGVEGNDDLIKIISNWD